MSERPAAWEPDPSGTHDHRYWDGSAWTHHVADAGVASVDPYDPTSVVPPPSDPVAVAPDPDPAVVDPAAAPSNLASPTAPTASAGALRPGAPAPPPPYVPGDHEADASGSPRKALLIGCGILAAVLVVVAVMAFGGGGHTDTRQLRADFASRFGSESDISAAQAACKADIYLSDIGSSPFKGIDVSDPTTELPSTLADKVTAANARAADECNISAAELNGTPSTTDGSGSESTATSTTVFSSATPSSLPPGYEKQLADVYRQQLNLSDQKATCLAHALAKAIEQGTITGATDASTALKFLGDCGITIDELTPK